MGARVDAYRLQYEATYARRPVAGARALAWLERRLEHAHTSQDRNETLLADLACRTVALRAVLRHLERCQRCGRKLRNDLSISRGIGPECWEKAPGL